MDTLADIIEIGNAAATAGEPLVTNWHQMRGALYLLGHVGGGIDQVRTSDFEIRFPANYAALDPAIQATLPSGRTYEIMRHQVSRLLACLGEIADPWEQLRMLIRRAGKDDIERCLPGLATPAKAAGLAPAQITSDWVWSLDAERGVLSETQLQHRSDRERRHGKAPKAKLACSVRQRLRQGVSVFNRLFQIPEIAASGLLPPEPIAAPPVYDRSGRQKVALPPKLDVKNAHRGIYPIWRAICAAGGLGLPDEPSPDDLIEPDTWAKITELSPSLIKLKPTSWTLYLTNARSQLLSAAENVPADPYALPARFEKVVQEKEDRWHFNLLWRQIRAADIPDIEEAGAAELLELDVWRALWCAPPDDMSYTTFKAFMRRARKTLLHHAPDQTDPLRVVARAWADLPAQMKTALTPIRNAAEAAFLRPQDVTAKWVDELVLDEGIKAPVCDALDGLSDAIRAAQADAIAAAPAPELQVWQDFRKIARSRGYKTQYLGPIANPAIEAGMTPAKLNRDWILQMSADLPHKRRALVGMALRELDAMLQDPQLAPLLYKAPLGPLPDARSPGMVDLPESLVAALTDIHDALGSADPTRREAHAAVRKIATAAVKQGVDISNLYELLKHAEQLGFEGAILRKAKRLRAHWENLWDTKV